MTRPHAEGDPAPHLLVLPRPPRGAWRLWRWGWWNARDLGEVLSVAALMVAFVLPFLVALGTSRQALAAALLLPLAAWGWRQVALGLGARHRRPWPRSMAVMGAFLLGASAVPRTSGRPDAPLTSFLLLFAVGALLVGARRATGSWRGFQAPDSARRKEETGRLIALGELSRAVAHGVRNSLSVVYSCASLLERERPAEQRSELLRTLAEEADRMKSFVDHLSSFASSAPLERVPLSLADVLREVAVRARREPTWPEGLPLDIVLATSGDQVLGDASHLEAALVQILLVVTRGASSVSVTETVVEQGGWTRVLVSLRGIGAPPPVETDNALAETLEPEHLWLAVARRVVRSHQGSLQLGASIDGDAEVVLQIPVIPD